MSSAARASRSRLAIVKLGGSHATGPHLKDWLAAIAAEAGAIAIVPGGGPFADAVRTAQASMGYDDRAAHAMALMAMAQFGCALESLNPALRLSASRSAILRALHNGRVPSLVAGTDGAGRGAAGNLGTHLRQPRRVAGGRRSAPTVWCWSSMAVSTPRPSAPRTSSHAASLTRYSHAILRRAALALGSRRQPTAGDSPKGCSAPYFLKSCERT